VALSNCVVASVTWRFYDSGGNLLAGAPAAMTSVIVQQVDLTGNVVYNSPALSSATLSHTFANKLAWTNLVSLRFLYGDTLNNSYVITYPNVLVSTPSELTALEYSSGGMVLQLNGQAGHGPLEQPHHDQPLHLHASIGRSSSLDRRISLLSRGSRQLAVVFGTELSLS
jgi:hypothetical protein